ncbi:MAG: hypothetical protein KDD58_11230 [Bdellovibrionales bacterium]|nr:hypothetical protein [Bdellovibrionales bacterium]
MNKEIFKLSLLLFLLYSALIALNVHDLNQESEGLNKKLFIPPPEQIKLMTFGYHENLADSLWLRWVQNPEECGKEKISRTVFEDNFQGYKEENKGKQDLSLGFDREKRKVCDKGWSFLMLDAVTNLAPKFRYSYLVGTTILSVLVEDHEGAALLYDKALKNFPDDWKLFYGAAYHFMFELDDIERAAKYLRRAGDLGAPHWVYSLASKLYTKSGQVFLGITSLKQYKVYLEKTGETKKIKEIDERISQLESQLRK